MTLQVLIGIILALGATVAVTKFILELSLTPVMSDEEWDTEMAKRSVIFLDINPAHMPVEPLREAPEA